MILTAQNYFSREADEEYLSASQFNHFEGTPVKKSCEAATMAALKGDWKVEPSVAMLVGSYVDAWFSNELNEFKASHPEITTQKGELKSDFKQAEEIIAFLQKDPYFMDVALGDGEPQVLIQGEIAGAKFKGKIDRLHKGKSIVDLKVVASIRAKIWVDETRTYTNFIDAYGYVRQGAIYQELWRQMSGEKLPFFIAAVSKEKVPDKEIIYIPDSTLELALAEIIEKVPYILKIKSGELPALRCGVCDYCKSIKMLSNAIDYNDLWG